MNCVGVAAPYTMYPQIPAIAPLMSNERTILPFWFIPAYFATYLLEPQSLSSNPNLVYLRMNQMIIAMTAAMINPQVTSSNIPGPANEGSLPVLGMIVSFVLLFLSIHVSGRFDPIRPVK